MYKFYSKSKARAPLRANIVIKQFLRFGLMLALILLSSRIFAQSQQITLKESNVPLKKVLQDLTKQTGFEFLASTAVLEVSQPVTINVKNLPVSTVLELIFKNQPLKYEIRDKIIVITKTEAFQFANRKDQHTTSAVKGKVIDTTGNPLPGSTIKNISKNLSAITSPDGEFEIEGISGDKITVSFIGFLSYDFQLNDKQNSLTIVLKATNSKLKEVSVVSTGYQTLPKERATGSFDLIDSTLINRNTSTNILDRLDGVTSGVLFNKSLGNGNNAAISVRGRNTIFANPDPLIVVDNFPYDGDLGNINPNDILNISLLKDAAAASIWGVRAGNGVIVITTKKGAFNKKAQVNFNANTTISQRPNIFYQPQISSSDYIDLEQFLYRKGYYDNTISDGFSTISPAVAIFLQKTKGQISAADSTAQINQLKKLDIRNDLSKYIYRPAINQQYSLSVNGGGQSNAYYISAGYDNNKENVSGNYYKRITLTANNSLSFLNNKLKVGLGITLASSVTEGNTNSLTTAYYPYQQLIDQAGNHLSLVQVGGLRKQFTDTAGNGRLLDWNYRPLDENSSNNQNTLTDYKLNGNVQYLLWKDLNFQVNYQYQKGFSDNTLLNSVNSYYTRNIINSFSQIDPNSGAVTRPVPYGGIENLTNSQYYAHSARAQLNYDHTFGGKHVLNLLGGGEIKDYHSFSKSSILYGFDPSDDSSLPVDNITYFQEYYGFNYGSIPYGGAQSFTVDRLRSVFFNGSYAYDSRYTLSLSARRDESNIFGVRSNQKGVPLWSTGFLWNINREAFYHSKIFPVLKFRATYGFNGNVDKTTSAYLTAQDAGPNVWNTEYTNIVNPPNPSLRWEKDRNINLGIDFITKGNLFSGSIEYYIKNGSDLIANSPIAPQTGVVQFKGNAADTRTNGFDIVINKNIVGSGPITWQSNILLSYSKDIVTNYKVKQPNNAQVINSNYFNPLQGYPYNAIFCYKFMGLDNQGRPQGLLNGQVSENYSAITLSSNTAELVYSGSATPLYYGSFRNTFAWKELEFSFNIIFKFDYVFRRPNVFSGSNYDSYGYLAADYNKRWQKPGDEAKTIIPALSYPINSLQDGFFRGSSALIERADNIRLQDVRLSYRFKSLNGPTALNNLRLTAYANNLGLIWKKTMQPLDPDFLYTNFVSPRTISLGVSTIF